MNKLTIILGVVALLTGCAVTPHDLSTGDETALVEGCKILPSGRKYYHAGFSAIIVDAGPVVILARCDPSFWNSGNPGPGALFRFAAEAGHTYSLSNSDEGCFQLVDSTAQGHVVACERYR